VDTQGKAEATGLSVLPFHPKITCRPLGRWGGSNVRCDGVDRQRVRADEEPAGARGNADASPSLENQLVFAGPGTTLQRELSYATPTSPREPFARRPRMNNQNRPRANARDAVLVWEEAQAIRLTKD
jgi:hypothetical protein